MAYRAIFAILAFGFLGSLVQAQDGDAYDTTYEADPPGRAARLSYLQGDVSLQPAGEEEWAPAVLNRPLTSGDKVWTERESRAEISVGPAAVRLDGGTGFSFLNVDDDTIQMRMTAGVLNVSVRDLTDREHIEIDTPNVAVVILREGSYRLEVNDVGDRTVVKVSQGAADVTGSGDGSVVHAGQAVSFFGVDEVTTRLDRLGSPDEFDDWALERDRREERLANSRTSEYVSPDVTGYEDLEEHGSWSSEPEYGYVWTPRYVSVDWSPYRYGRWVWISPWGWTWIDDAPWGYAPFHYGRWVHLRHRWCWVPGPRHHRAVYAPALVGWYGGHGLHVSWFPLGPHEVYVPWHRHSRRYVDRVNGPNVDRRRIADVIENRVRDRYRNSETPNGVTSVSRDSFRSGGRIGDRRVRDNDQSVRSGLASTIAPRIDPSRESRLGGQVRANVRRPPATVANRPVVVRRDPPAAFSRFARRPQETRDETRDVAQAPAQRPQTQNSGGVSSSLRDRIAARNSPDGRNDSRADNRSDNGVQQPRNDRPPRADRPAQPVARSPVTDPRAIAERVREDRERQVRERADESLARQRREADSSRREREPAPRDRVQRDQDDVSSALRQRFEQREQRQRTEERAVERVRERPRVERPREQPRMERPREQPRVERPREQPRAERPREQPRAERPREQPRAPQPRQDRTRGNDDGGRRHRN